MGESGEEKGERGAGGVAANAGGKDVACETGRVGERVKENRAATKERLEGERVA